MSDLLFYNPFVQTKQKIYTVLSAVLLLKQLQLSDELTSASSDLYFYLLLYLPEQVESEEFCKLKYCKTARMLSNSLMILLIL